MHTVHTHIKCFIHTHTPCTRRMHTSAREVLCVRAIARVYLLHTVTYISLYIYARVYIHYSYEYVKIHLLRYNWIMRKICVNIYESTHMNNNTYRPNQYIFGEHKWIHKLSADSETVQTDITKKFDLLLMWDHFVCARSVRLCSIRTLEFSMMPFPALLSFVLCVFCPTKIVFIHSYIGTHTHMQKVYSVYL